MQAQLLQRKLRYLDRDEEFTVDQEFLCEDGRSMVVLGEAGMGKSTLLSQMAGIEGFTTCTARKLINTKNVAALMGNAHTLVIDAVDEVSARVDGDAVDLVLQRLEALQFPRFILSCRVADWRKATALQGISEFYDTAPLELHLQPLSREDAVSFLAATVGEDAADRAVKTLEEAGLGGLWSNPQTLKLVADVVARGSLPASKGELFDAATQLMWSEHRDERSATPLAARPRDDVLDAAGAAFALLILTGKEALSRKAMVQEHDAPLADVSRLPGGAALADVLGSRLFSGLHDERFGYDHRAIGEFLGARWLARQATTPRKQRRVLELFKAQGLVPASLRGLHAWLAWHQPSLAEAVISADPMGVIEYGDANKLTVVQGRAMLAALRELFENDPNIRGWSGTRVRGLAQRHLLTEVRAAVLDTQGPSGFRQLVLNALRQSLLVVELQDELSSLLQSSQEIYRVRRLAGDLLAEAGIGLDWSEVCKALLAQAALDDVELVCEIVVRIGCDHFDDCLLLELLQKRFEQSEKTSLAFISFDIDFAKRLPENRLDAILGGIAEIARSAGRPHQRRHGRAIANLMFALLARRLAMSIPEVSILWSWLEPFAGASDSEEDARKAVARVFESDDKLRRSLQNYALLTLPSDLTVTERYWRFVSRSDGLRVTEDDVCVLLEGLDRDDVRWSDVVRLAWHGSKKGAAVRVAASRFAAADPKSAQWLEDLALDVVPQWQVQQENEKRERMAALAAEWADHRIEFTHNIEKLRSGDEGYIISPATAYLKLFQEMDQDETDGPARLHQWLGPELRDAALVGFDAFLKKVDLKPTASEIVSAYVEDKRWHVDDVFIAASAERCRTGRGFDDLSAERLMACLFALRTRGVEQHAEINGLDDHLVDQIRRRGCYDQALRLLVEPQLAAGRRHVTGLWQAMHSDDDGAVIEALAIDWLTRFPNMSEDAEVAILDRILLSAGGRSWLAEIVSARRSLHLDASRRRSWDAIGLIVDFAETLASLTGRLGVEPELLWALRAWLAARNHRVSREILSIDQFAWMISTFRSHFPLVRRPSVTVTTGDTNPWDATEFLLGVISRLGDVDTLEAAAALARLRDGPVDGYTDFLKTVAAEQTRKRIEKGWRAPDIETVVSAVVDQAPTTCSQFLAVMIEELKVVQAKITGSDVNWHRRFWGGDIPDDEENCRDAILQMFGTLPFGIKGLPEGHLADAKRCDIFCFLDEMMIPIEIKGQWHKALWTAADEQLDRLYVNDYRAERGIYLVLWFGPGTCKPLQREPGAVDNPKSAAELKDALIRSSRSAGDGRVEIIVLDLTRPA
jgi:energy-coupling factor transporter ATP-binding protein EcfA2